jgi:hypothetical protein
MERAVLLCLVILTLPVFRFVFFMRLFILLFLMLRWCHASPPESRLLTDLLRGYLIDERPVVESKQPVAVKLGVILQQIIDLNERMEQLTVNVSGEFESKGILFRCGSNLNGKMLI